MNHWSIHYAALCHYGKKFGSCNVPQSVVYKCDLPGLGVNGGAYHYEENLGNWLNNQRQAKKGQGSRKLLVAEKAQLQKLVDEGNYNSC